MVYVGQSAQFLVKPKFIEREGKAFLCAEDSSLGADNGVALACMLLALRDCQNIECLFTIDEEVGMIGAREITLPLLAPYMLNCDSEEIDEVVCSCAGGYDLECKMSFPSLEITKDCEVLEICTQGFIGGHSGIEIHKGIPNAILELAKVAQSLIECGALAIEFCGGEKRNSIPVNATLSVAIPQEGTAQCKEILERITQGGLGDCVQFKVTKKPLEKQRKTFDICKLLEAILDLQNGVIVAQNTEPILSSNLGILQQDFQGEKVQIEFVVMGRGNQESLMQDNIAKEKMRLEALGFEVELLDYYAPWEREESELLQNVLQIAQKHNPNAQLKSIHAGLECGILKQKYPSICFASIGPNISHPHSVREELDLESFVCFDKILQDVLKRFGAF